MKPLNPKKQGLRYGIPLLSLFLLLTSCLGWILEKPSFVLREITLTPRSLTEMTLLLGFDIHNPNRFDLTLQSFEYTVFLDNEEIGNGRLEKELLIPSSSITRAQAPIAASFKNLGGSLKSVISGLAGKDVVYKMEGKARVKALFGSVNFTFSKEGRIH